jgi:hypothetical protein
LQSVLACFKAPRAYEARDGELGNLIRPTRPARIVADLGPGKTSLKQVHVRIGFAPVGIDLAREKACGRAPPLFFDLAPELKSAALEMRSRIKRDRRRCKSEQYERLILKERAIVEPIAVDPGKRAIQTILAPPPTRIRRGAVASTIV